MTSLYVDRKGVEIRAEADSLVFFEAGQRVGCVQLRPLERVYLRRDVVLQANVLGRLGERGIGEVVMSGRKGEAALLMHRPHNDAARRIAQYRVSQDAEQKLRLARRRGPPCAALVSKRRARGGPLQHGAGGLPFGQGRPSPLLRCMGRSAARSAARTGRRGGSLCHEVAPIAAEA